ncbi:reverse transcriptase N-terminal domain-containing protein [Achromobacter aegrifaciens]
MTADDTKVPGAGASSPAAQMWDQSNWPHIEAEVKRLQTRIVKAVREGRRGKVKALQRLLTRSHSGKLLAVKRVTENSNKRTPGVDGKVWLTLAARWKGMLSLRHCGYRPMPLRQVYIPKSNGPFGIPCMRCRAEVGSAQASRQRGTMGLEALLPDKRITVLGLCDEGVSRRHNCWPSTLPGDDDTRHSSCQGSRCRPSVRPGMDCVFGSSSSRDTIRQIVRCHPVVLKNGLSRMRGDSHVRFLGGGGAAMRRCYPTP